MEPVIVSSAAAATGVGDVLAGIGWGITFFWIVFMIVREYAKDWRRVRRNRRNGWDA